MSSSRQGARRRARQSRAAGTGGTPPGGAEAYGTGWIACSARGRARRPSHAISTPGPTTRAGRIRSAIPGLRPRARRRAVPASCRRNKPFHQPLLTMRALSAGQRRGGRAFRSSIAGAAGRCCGFRPFGRRRGSAAPCRGLCCCGHCRPRYHARRGRRCFRHCHHRLRRGRRMRRARSPGPRAPRRGEPRYQRRPLLDVILRNVLLHLVHPDAELGRAQVILRVADRGHDRYSKVCRKRISAW